jgi:hypothetical protein
VSEEDEGKQQRRDDLLASSSRPQLIDDIDVRDAASAAWPS